MTVTTSPSATDEDTPKSLRTANAFFLAQLTHIVGDVSGLTDGDDEFDYFIPVPLTNLHAISQRIAELQYDVKQRFHVNVSALPIPIGD